MRRLLSPLLAGLFFVVAAAIADQAQADDAATTPSLPPEISRSRGTPGGVVLLWPRVVPATDSAQTSMDAGFIQAQLRIAIANAIPGVSIDVRPQPERVCPRGGCKGVAVGTLLAHDEAGCAVVATVSAPGESEARLVLMAGRMDITARAIPFRDPPENYITIWDFDRCVDLGNSMEPRMTAFEGALRSVMPGTTAAPATPAPPPPAPPAVQTVVIPQPQ